MGDLLQRGSAWLAKKFASHISQSIEYSRGAFSVTLAATPGATELTLVDTSGFGTAFHAVDFLFQAADLDFGDGAVEPAEGDRIVFDGKTYELLSIPGAQCFRYSDPHRIGIRVHTKLVGT